ncbi:hypothetical protein BDD12DRAFT_773091 [Trichophaea hybrida]|nr:hypothetical protein BDD12DRAFT_773091 [Trichophaea hybrida]
MVKSYLRWEHLKTFGIVASGTANAVWTPEPTTAASRTTGAGRAVVPANEEVLTWDIKKGELLSRWSDPKNKSEVSVISQSRTDSDIFAIGYTDGSIRLWDSKTATVVISFNGHKSAVSALAWDHSGTRLASGGRDAHIIVWDLIAEVGLYRLRGHKDQITGLEFLRSSEEEEDTMRDAADGDGWILSTGKDTLIKLWDLSIQHCVETHVAHHGECWTMALMPDERGCITAGHDGEMKVWSIDMKNLGLRAISDTDCIVDRGTLYRQIRDRAASVKFHPDGSFFAVHGADKNVEVWRIRGKEEVQKALKRKRKRKEQKGEKVEDEGIVSAGVGDIFVSYVAVRTGGKVKSVDWALKPRSKASDPEQLLVSCTNNSLEFYDIEKLKEKKKAEVPEYNKLYSVELPGHRTDIRSLSLSRDDRMLASASNGSLKIWNVRTGACIRTFECGYALCCSFLPGDKIVVVGTKSGEIEMFDVASSALIETVVAHEGAIWALQVHPDGKSLVTSSADKSAKFWDFEVVQEEIPGTRRTTPRLKLKHTRILKLSDDILSVCYSPNGKLLALSLLDNTVKVFFVDTLKHLLNLYGHKLPVLSMDISHDSKLIATCSADKNVKVWGLDFGDCHKSFFAHQDSIMQVKFEKNSHNFFSASKDKLIKYWDGDKFENIMKLEGHFGEVLALAVGKTSDTIVTASHDKSIRVWEQIDEPIFLEEEREKELEELYESTLTTSLEGEEGEGDEATSAGKQTMETLMAGEKIMEALEIGINDLAMMKEYHATKESRPNLAPPPRNAQYIALGGISAEKYLLDVVQRIKAASLQDALLVLPFNKAVDMLTFLDIWAEREWNISLTCRILFFILKTHHKQIVASKTMRNMLDSVRGHLRAALKHQKDEMGFNLAAVRYIKSGVDAKKSKNFMDEEEYKGMEEKNKKKRGFATLA